MDDKIIDAISRAPATLNEIMNHCGAKMSEVRDYDRALQRLKRKGSIHFNRAMRRWVLAEPFTSAATATNTGGKDR